MYRQMELPLIVEVLLPNLLRVRLPIEDLTTGQGRDSVHRQQGFLSLIEGIKAAKVGNPKRKVRSDHIAG